MRREDIERLREVEWKDLLHLRTRDVVHELSLSLPWLLASWISAVHHQYLIALASSFLFFLTGLRQVHSAFHYSLGISRRATEWVMFALSILMLGSMHAVQLNHIRHHKHCMDEDDVEAMSARLPAWQAILIGPLFPLRLHHKAMRIAGPRHRRWLVAELMANAITITLVLAMFDVSWLRYHVLAMAIGQCLTAFFAVWMVHHGCADTAPFARTIRGRVSAMLTYNMFFHAEHHLFPAVPTSRLPRLAERLDAIAPELVSKRVL